MKSRRQALQQEKELLQPLTKKEKPEKGLLPLQQLRLLVSSLYPLNLLQLRTVRRHQKRI
uniref:Uncharacterized protein n=1 Tax=Cucumis melo TaxID=3656 RepID=A0A9I9D8Y0_CUCME